MGKHRHTKPNKLGRNDPCFCGSGVKYKKCCLPKGLKPPVSVPAEVLEMLSKQQIKMAHQKALLESKGIYINMPNTTRFQGKSFMAVGNKLMYDDDQEASFHQLLFRNLMLVLGEDWWNQEASKDDANRHIVRKWFAELGDNYQDPRLPHQKHPNGLNSIPATGYTQSLLSLAFDVYLLAHKGYLPDGWINRLRNYQEYQGVRYEIAVASLFVRIGCSLEFYTKERSAEGHVIRRPEFIAELPLTNDRVAVEAKSRHRNGVLHQDGKQDLHKAMLGDVTKLFNDAIAKDHGDLPYLIFIDVNAPIDEKKTVETRWFSDIKKMLETHTKNLGGKPELYNGVVSTNFSPHYHEDNPTYGGGYAIAINQHMPNDIIGGSEGVFMSMLVAAIDGYGFVPPDMNQ